MRMIISMINFKSLSQIISMLIMTHQVGYQLALLSFDTLFKGDTNNVPIPKGHSFEKLLKVFADAKLLKVFAEKKFTKYNFHYWSRRILCVGEN